jgi:hypothetical protein
LSQASGGPKKAGHVTASSECLQHSINIHYGDGDFMHPGRFGIEVSCATIRTPFKAVGYYTFSIDENGKVATVAAMYIANP